MMKTYCAILLKVLTKAYIKALRGFRKSVWYKTLKILKIFNIFMKPPISVSSWIISWFKISFAIISPIFISKIKKSKKFRVYYPMSVFFLQFFFMLFSLLLF